MSNDVNAFAADNGVILVTTGLLAKIQNEAQLAFVLCHEFSHYYSQHALEKVEEQIFYRTYSSDHIHLTETQRAIAQFKYSKEQEYAADDQGLQFFKNTNYDDAAIDGLYDILLYSYLPIRKLVFQKRILMIRFIIFLKQISEILLKPLKQMMKTIQRVVTPMLQAEEPVF